MIGKGNHLGCKSLAPVSCQLPELGQRSMSMQQSRNLDCLLAGKGYLAQSGCVCTLSGVARRSSDGGLGYSKSEPKGLGCSRLRLPYGGRRETLEAKKWQDTVMNDEESWEIYKANGGRGVPPREQVNSVAKAQAERTESMLKDEWKKSGLDSAPEPWDREQTVFNDGKKVGQKEVVEWIDNNVHFVSYLDKEWRAFLKEMGL